jgi:tetratricopeptide (TPR) repeat protein
MPTIEERLTTAVRLQAVGRIAEAERIYRDVLREEPRQAHAMHFLGLIANQVGRQADAIELIRRALAIQGPHPVFHSNLASVYAAMGRAADAEQHAREAIRLMPDLADAYNNLGVALRMQGRLHEAAAAFRESFQLVPGQIDARCNLVHILEGRAQLPEALAVLQEGVRLAPNHAQARNLLGGVLLALVWPGHAIPHLREAVRLRPGFHEALNNLGLALQAVNQGEEAIRCFREALRIQPESILARQNLAHALETQGLIEEATAELEECLRRVPNDPMSLARLGHLAALGHCSLGGERLAHLQKWAADLDLPIRDRSLYHQALAWAEEKAGHYNEAFTHCRRARELRKEFDRQQGVAFDPAGHRQLIDRIIAVSTPEWFQRVASFGSDSERPVFIVGMMRSGTTLVEQILASHPKVSGAGELPDMKRLAGTLSQRLRTTSGYPDCLSALDKATARVVAEEYLQTLRRLGGDAERVVDKMPFNFLRLGLIAVLFPRARIIHCRRDPVDTCLSAYFQSFVDAHPFTLDLAHLGTYYREYERLMEHWRRVLPVRVYDLQYEQLTANQERVSRELIDYCGLEWDDRCLRFSETRRVVRTASAVQVRQGMYQSAVGKWKRYEAHLGPLLEALGLSGKDFEGRYGGTSDGGTVQ